MPEIASLLYLVIYILILGLLVYAVSWLLTQIALPQPVKTIVLAVLGILALLWLAQQVGLL